MTKGQDSDTSNNNPRSRGIRASQKKLRAALLAAGFKSQTEVSDKIQKIEGLKKPPRSLVRRVFHGDSVDPLSIERVAKALNKEAWTLYLDSAELEEYYPNNSSVPKDSGELIDNPKPDNNHTPNTNSTLTAHSQALQPATQSPTYPTSKISNAEFTIFGLKIKKSKTTLVVVLLVVLGSIVIDRFWSSNVGLEDNPLPAGIIDFRNKVVAVIPIKGPRGVDITRHVEQLLANKTQYIAGSSALHASIGNPQELLSGKKADLVISGEIVEVGRYLAVRLFLSQDQNKRQLLSAIVAKSASEKYIQDQLEGGINTLVNESPQTESADWQILQRFLRGMRHFGGERSEQAILRGMAEFQGVIGSAPNLVYGYAGMCFASVEQSIETSSKSYLEEAARYCDKGAEIAPNSLFINVALGNLARAKGEFSEAREHYLQALDIEPNSIPAIQKYSENQLREFLKSHDPAVMEDIKNRLTFANKIEPDNWKLPFTLGRAYYFSGDQYAAIEQFEYAARLSVNFQTLNNLGTLQFCVGDLLSAKSNYQQAFALRPEYAVLLSNIATLHFYLEENEQALAIYEPQIKQLQQSGGPGLYQLWSNVASIYRIQGKNEQALSAYRNAMTELDREVNQGEANVMQRATRLAMYVLVTVLSPNMQTEQLLASLKQQALALNDVVDPVSLHHLALSWLYLGDEQRARIFRDKLHAICPGYAASPDFGPLEKGA
ncbi:tetratricopeptide repeat protein [Paraglaciecola arctica]|uniref:Tetratricopeptide TPR_2 n=1 Tax=Paraglaciecola arctica BSs20135 TaxID=493475 RepID=K6Z713_9ALTE|nr:tetratricopeptide repeat protein [Paraglaciecola arctica]GAC19240.1 tetratricopeptide TPR_2 [Paraglaciecola arctica BSs20135]